MDSSGPVHIPPLPPMPVMDPVAIRFASHQHEHTRHEAHAARIEVGGLQAALRTAEAALANAMKDKAALERQNNVMSEESTDLQMALQKRSREAIDRDRLYQQMQLDLLDRGRF